MDTKSYGKIKKKNKKYFNLESDNRDDSQNCKKVKKKHKKKLLLPESDKIIEENNEKTKNQDEVTEESVNEEKDKLNNEDDSQNCKKVKKKHKKKLLDSESDEIIEENKEKTENQNDEVIEENVNEEKDILNNNDDSQNCKKVKKKHKKLPLHSESDEIIEDDSFVNSKNTPEKKQIKKMKRLESQSEEIIEKISTEEEDQDEVKDNKEISDKDDSQNCTKIEKKHKRKLLDSDSDEFVEDHNFFLNLKNASEEKPIKKIKKLEIQNGDENKIVKQSESEEDEDDEEEIDGVISDEGDELDQFNIFYTLYEPNNQERRKLRSMKIQLRHTPPPQHCIEKVAGTRTLNKEERDEFNKYIELKTGTFSKDEIKTIKRNWKAFCKLHKWEYANRKPFLQMKLTDHTYLLNKENRIKFVQFLADGLNDRSLYSVYQRFKVIYEPHKVNRYTPSEDQTILNFVRDCGKKVNDRKFADLAIILRRTRASVWRRYRLLKQKKEEE